MIFICLLSFSMFVKSLIDRTADISACTFSMFQYSLIHLLKEYPYFEPYSNILGIVDSLFLLILVASILNIVRKRR